ncbi:AAA family ATPase [Saccharospirillum mangrovi]|uniref:AAA family ATPase n=1 Tax=Saccharospirillum mangrovi TaxID=2161747 RepID=UPI000D367E3A|nr:AAA family ATPase [Saccharospirillum mangrovi]
MEPLPYLRQIKLKRDEISDFGVYPFVLPVVSSLDALDFAPGVTMFVGENGSGKSTLLEAIAIGMGFNPEGGTRNFNFVSRQTHSDLNQFLTFSKSFKRPRDGFFLRAESFYNVATNMDELDEQDTGKLEVPNIKDSYGGRSLHHQSHGEAFLSLFVNRFGGGGLYLLDEPEAALSPSRQLAMLNRMRELVQAESQFIVATHSPILMAYPGATIYQVDETGVYQVEYEETEHYQLSRAFLNNPKTFLRELFADDDE